MEQLRINSNEYSIDVTVRESDEYTRAVYLKFDCKYASEEIHGCSEMFMTPSQMDNLGRFLIRQAQEIATMQEVRRSTYIVQS